MRVIFPREKPGSMYMINQCIDLENDFFKSHIRVCIYIYTRYFHVLKSKQIPQIVGLTCTCFQRANGVINLEISWYNNEFTNIDSLSPVLPVLYS